MISFFQKNVVLSSLLLYGLIVIISLFQGSYIGLFLPFAVAFIYILLYRIDLVLYSTVFFVPLSLNFEHLPLGFGLILPTEPILAVTLLVVLTRILWIEKKTFSHPISIIVLLHLGWMAITVVTSTLPFVSLKYFIARCWFVVPFYFLPLKLFKDGFNFKRYTMLYITSFAFVIVYIIYNHYLTGFANSAVYKMTLPFYKDHTSYGAVLAMLLPFTYFYFRNTKVYFDKVMLLFFFILYFVAIILSYTRAAWISLLVGIIFYLILKFKVKFKVVFLGFFTFVTLLVAFNYQIKSFLLKNGQDASDNFTEHLNSIYNISTDASNVERINRWTSAIEMFKEKPVFGFGPGTYAFKYGPFQKAEYKTIISTNFGDVGTAHSEYLGPLSEMGLIGSILFISLVIAVLYYGVKNYRNVKVTGTEKWLNTAALIGLVTYFTHGFLNNYLDTDKASALFWVFIAFITFININKVTTKTATRD